MGRIIGTVRHPAATAAITWVLAIPAAMLLPAVAGRSPFTPRGAVLPIAVGGLLLAAGLALAAFRRRGTDPPAGAAAGLLAAWVALSLRNGLYGTPFGFAGLTGDQGRMSAMATRYSATAVPSDGIVAGVPTEYPPLFPWLVGRAAALLDVPAWRLLGDAQILAVSAAVLLAFLLWARLVPAPAALVIAAATLVAFGDPRKAHEVIALAVFIPWVPAAIGRPSRARLHWLPAGLLGGLIVATYLGFVLWGALGMLVLAWSTWRASEDRRGYLKHLAKLLVAAAAVSGWYLVPYAWTLIRDGGQMVSDLFPAPAITGDPFPFLAATPLGALQAIGLLGMVWYRKTAWWATPLLCLVAGAYLYRAMGTARYILTGHTGLYYHTARMVAALLAVAGVLTLMHALPALVRRLATRDTVPHGVTATAIAVLIGWIGFAYWQAWTPPTSDPAAATGNRRYAVLAHTEPRPDGTRPRYAPDRPATRWFPINPIKRAVKDALGPHATPHTLSYDERLFAYLPWPGYIAVDRTAASSTSHWDDRHAALAALANTTGPKPFANASRTTPYGPIDVFILRANTSTWTWQDVHFHPTQFAPQYFTVRSLPADTVIAVRRPG
ncbi:arabinofuranosyltransferase [Actinomadura darangshiensis]|nr:arabinofuranosyltransferase [Actinomadura darangshiensis]